MYTSYPTELHRGGLWAGWQITGQSCCHGDWRVWRRWITHQCSSLNHQSPLTSHHRHWHPLTRTHTRARAHSRKGYRTKSHRGWVLLTNHLKLWENAAPCYIPLLSVCESSASLPLLSLPHVSSPVIAVSAVLFLTCFSLTCFALFSIPLHLRVHLHPSVPGTTVVHQSHVLHSLPSATERANHCWHFKRHGIKWPTVGWVCESTICSMTSTSPSTLSFVSGLASRRTGWIIATSKSHNNKSNQPVHAMDGINDSSPLPERVSIIDLYLPDVHPYFLTRHALNFTSSLQISDLCFWGRRPQHPCRHSSGQRPRWWRHNLLRNSRQWGGELRNWQPERWYILILWRGLTFVALALIDRLSVESHIQFSLTHSRYSGVLWALFSYKVNEEFHLKLILKASISIRVTLFLLLAISRNDDII